MIQADHPLAVTRRCTLLEVARSTVYYRPTGISAEDLTLMRRLDEIHLERPFYGSRRLRDELETQGHPMNRKRVQRLMRQMGLRALYPRPRTSQPGVGHTVYPYLLRGLSIERPNQVWATDICYIPMAHGFMYLVAIMDWYARRVLAWRVSNTFDSDFCVEALEDALTRYGPPEIFNTDQGAQFTSKAFTTVLKAHAVAISMDGKGRWVDNVFVERLWRSVKYEDVYLHAYDTPAALRAGVLVPLAVDQAAVRCSYGHENVGSSAVPGSLRWTITGMRTTATKKRRERPRAVKMSLQFSRVLTTPACIAGVLVSRPNFNALCGRPKL